MSNKQVAAIFIVGIVLLLGAFGAGLYVVKQDSTPATDANKTNAPGAGNNGNDSAARYIVHVASFGTDEEAKKLMTELRRKYISAFVQSPNANDQSGLYHVNIGPFDKRDADQVSEDLRKDGRKGVIVKRWNQN
ncbi:MAG TPA: SPOR domain-containing protein [Blastocatellia bacterium]|nr:SPOR domain-containing protein [Blastocatellia bacterium]